VLHGVKAGAIGEHPAGKDALDLSGELDLVNLDEERESDIVTQEFELRLVAQMPDVLLGSGE